ncbi:unnamed protein product [Nesidiocoris tenuis]|uniref:Ig-like domain-containing protein n=1 Tax=Nesidiocoris tenuis TaxID=355587 RepID=A0A6H5GFM6_9HEMI|nr:unnamed protein product [Nesidiocoris tenuis]
MTEQSIFPGNIQQVTGIEKEGRSCFHVSLKAPRYADVGGQVVLECEYNVHPDQLHKVEWLKGGRKLFQYVKGRTPPFRNFSTPGAVLDVSVLHLSSVSSQIPYMCQRQWHKTNQNALEAFRHG